MGLRIGQNLEAVMMWMLLAVCVIPQVMSQHHTQDLEIAINLSSGDASNEQTPTSCSDFRHVLSHVSTLGLSSGVVMRSACSCSVQALSEHYPMFVTLQHPDDRPLPQLELREDLWRTSSELALTVKDNKVVVDACNLHYEQSLPVKFVFGNEAGAILNCTEVTSESPVPTETKCRDLPTANQPVEKQQKDLPLVLIGVIVGICLVGTVVVNVIITVSIKHGCSRRRRRTKELTDTAPHEHEHEHVNVISHSASMDFEHDDNQPAEDAMRAQYTTFVPSNTHSNQSDHLEPQNQVDNPCYQTSNTNTIPKKYPHVRTDLDTFVTPVKTSCGPKGNYSYAYASNEALANSGPSQPFPPSLNSISPNTQCNSRVKEMARLKSAPLDNLASPGKTSSVPSENYSYAYGSHGALANKGPSQSFSPSFNSVSPNTQCNSRVKEMARLLGGQAPITSYDSAYVPDTTGADQASMLDQLHRVIQPPCVYGEERQYVNLPCTGLPKM